jgi:Fic family protein
MVDQRGWPDRLVIALEQSLIGGTDRARYAAETAVSTATATNDLRRLSDAGLLAQTGRGKATRYHASEGLRAEVGLAERGEPQA